MPALIPAALSAYDLDTYGHLLRFARLYPMLCMEIHTRAHVPPAFEWPHVGFIHDGDFIDSDEACSLGYMPAVDAVLLDVLNHENGSLERMEPVRDDPLTTVANSDDLNLVLRVLQNWAQIRSGDVAALFFGDDSDDQWRKAGPADRRACLLAYLTFESEHVSEEDKRIYKRTDAKGNDIMPRAFRLATRARRYRRAFQAAQASRRISSPGLLPGARAAVIRLCLAGFLAGVGGIWALVYLLRGDLIAALTVACVFASLVSLIGGALLNGPPR